MSIIRKDNGDWLFIGSKELYDQFQEALHEYTEYLMKEKSKIVNHKSHNSVSGSEPIKQEPKVIS